MARSEYRRCPPRLLLRPGVQAAIASEDNHTVTSPRQTRARLYAGQFATRYFVLYVGWTFDFIPIVWLLRRVTRSPPPPAGSSCNNATIHGYEAMHMIRKGQARWVSSSDVRRQIQFIHRLFEVAA